MLAQWAWARRQPLGQAAFEHFGDLPQLVFCSGFAVNGSDRCHQVSPQIPKVLHVFGVADTQMNNREHGYGDFVEGVEHCAANIVHRRDRVGHAAIARAFEQALHTLDEGRSCPAHFDLIDLSVASSDQQYHPECPGEQDISQKYHDFNELALFSSVKHEACSKTFTVHSLVPLTSPHSVNENRKTPLIKWIECGYSFVFQMQRLCPKLDP